MSLSANNVDAMPALTIQEIITLIIKDKGIHEGFYAPQIQFGFTGEPDFIDDVLVPTVKIAIHQIGIVRMEEESPACVNAAVVNPKPKTRTRKIKPE